jgi:hypothetical protein
MIDRIEFRRLLGQEQTVDAQALSQTAGAFAVR